MKKMSFVTGLMLTLCLVSSAMAGDVVGKVLFQGKAPKAVRLRMGADAVCMRQHKAAVFSEGVVVNKNGTLKNVLIYVKEGLGGKKFDPPKEKIVFDQKGCLYTPHVLGIHAGQEVEILNSDPTLHNVHSLSKQNPQFNIAQPLKGMKMVRKFDKPETFKIKCEVHSWMSAYFGVFSHPFFAVTGENGAFTLKNLPAGEYTIEAWHEKYGTQSMKVTVGATDKKTVDFKFIAK